MDVEELVHITRDNSKEVEGDSLVGARNACLRIHGEGRLEGMTPPTICYHGMHEMINTSDSSYSPRQMSCPDGKADDCKSI